jgi:hypothetical protein
MAGAGKLDALAVSSRYAWVTPVGALTITNERHISAKAYDRLATAGTWAAGTVRGPTLLYADRQGIERV